MNAETTVRFAEGSRRAKQPSRSGVRHITTIRPHVFYVATVSSLVFALAPHANAVVVDSPEEFNAEGANPTDGEIVIKNGSHSDWGVLEVSASGASGAPITVRGATPTGVKLKDDVRLKITGDWIEVYDLRVEGEGPPNPDNWTFETKGQNILIHDVEFVGRGNNSAGGYYNGNILIRFGTRDLEIHDCTFEGFGTDAIHVHGEQLPGSNANIGRDIYIHDNDFLAGRVESAISIGVGGGTLETTNVRIENNHFVDHEGVTAAGCSDPPDRHCGNGFELIEVKHSGNVIRHNDFINSVGYLSNRAGTGNVYDGNLIQPPPQESHFGGIRISDRDTQAVNNLFIGGRSGVELQWSDQVGYAVVTNTLIAHNTFIDPEVYAIATSVPEDTTIPPDESIIANNVLIGDGARMLAAQLGTNVKISRNLFHATTGQLQGPTGEGAIVADPELAPPYETATFPATSPVIDMGVELTTPFFQDLFEPDPAVTVAFDGTDRNQICKADIGHLELPESVGGSCDNQPPSVAASANGLAFPTVVTVQVGEDVFFDTDASDPDGLGYPIFFELLGLAPNEIVYVWDFDGGVASNPLGAFTAAPTVTYSEAGDYYPTVEVYDRLGSTTVEMGHISVTAP